MKKAILTLNSGSSTIKFAVFTIKNKSLNKEYQGLVDNVLKNPVFSIKNSSNNKKIDLNFGKRTDQDPYEFAIHKILDYIQKDFEIIAAGHRIVHGGSKYYKPIKIDDKILDYLDTLTPLAALHQPYNLKGVRILKKIFPKLLQIGCFDTAFHKTCPIISQIFAIPKKFTEQGIKRYGFHGLSYEYIVSEFDKHLSPKTANGKVIIAHLGSGVSMCALDKRKSVAVSMGFSVLDGLPMSTRCGSIDAGVLLHLLKNYNISVDELSHLLYKESGILGISGISPDMRELLKSNSKDAKLAVDYFIHKVSTWIGTFTAELQGLNALIFTAGIGENSSLIRKRICEKLKWLGIQIDQKLNEKGNFAIHNNKSKIPVYVIPTDEELMIARHTYKYLSLIG